MTTPFTASARDTLLDEYFAVQRELADVIKSLDEPATPAAIDRFGTLRNRLGELRESYRRSLPERPLSRCPLTGHVLRYSIDTLGLNGLWWDYYGFVRQSDPVPPSFFALTGALALQGPLERTTFVSRPGPETPFVIPRILAHEAVRAVVSHCRVGRHRAYAVSYFADPAPFDLARVNTWGTDQYTFLNPFGALCRAQLEPTAADMDFDLERWIRAGKLLWIAAGDQTLVLRSDARRCPYLRLDGRRELASIWDGKVWLDSQDTSDTPSDAAATTESPA
jgi:hypothetical protein